MQETTIPDIRKTIVLNAPIAKVWSSVTNADAIAAWFMPNNFEPVLGASFELRSPYGVSPCLVTELEPPRRLAFNWGQDWHVIFELEELENGAKTQFTLIHGGWSAEKVTETGDPHAVIRDRMNGGWDSGVLPRLKAFVEA